MVYFYLYHSNTQLRGYIPFSILFSCLVLFGSLYKNENFTLYFYRPQLSLHLFRTQVILKTTLFPMMLHKNQAFSFVVYTSSKGWAQAPYLSQSYGCINTKGPSFLILILRLLGTLGRNQSSDGWLTSQFITKSMNQSITWSVFNWPYCQLLGRTKFFLYYFHFYFSLLTLNNRQNVVKSSKIHMVST